MKYHNQLTITIDASVKWGDYLETMRAARELTNSGLKLFLYLSSQTPQCDIFFSPSHFCLMMNTSMSSEKRAFTELIEKKYLIKTDKSDIFIFYSINQNE